MRRLVSTQQAHLHRATKPHRTAKRMSWMPSGGLGPGEGLSMGETFDLARSLSTSSSASLRPEGDRLDRRDWRLAA
jgi:hypothetical protein